MTPYDYDDVIGDMLNILKLFLKDLEKNRVNIFFIIEPKKIFEIKFYELKELFFVIR